jgi:superoxide dismutase, Fe-Mn family
MYQPRDLSTYLYHNLQSLICGIMAVKKFYELPKLPYGYKDLEPYISERLLTLHHDKHHQGYVNGANADRRKLDEAREKGIDIDQKALLKELSFNIGGHVLHGLFWPNLAPEGKGGGEPGGKLVDAIDKEFGSFDRFKKEFVAATAVEGSAWTALGYCTQTDRPIIMQIEKHNVDVYPTFKIVMVLDLWEHAFYLDYENNKGKFIDAFWNIVNWDEVEKRLERIIG